MIVNCNKANNGVSENPEYWSKLLIKAFGIIFAIKAKFKVDPVRK